MSACKACGRPVRWVRSAATGRLVELDPDPMPDGSIMLLANGAARFIVAEQRATCVAPLFRLHAAACPSAAAGGSR